ncbi:hypothetical protein K7X08_022812 [Anisodus acutangulus]|uniref:Uncharacterized protein n=1 Tax=Anisodus acutangulus TaxID=402998 RepID=A0A9Q1REK2_9SOLA|nr:hypothetical protein K7X08_022812 [Anisodus acutangulus]
MLVGVNPVELMTLKQQLEEGQVKMQSRLEEEEEAKAALMSLIQRLTKLILVSSKNSIPGYLGDVAGHQRSHSPSEDDKMDSSMLIDTSDLKHRRSCSKWNDGISHVGNAITESAQEGIPMSDQMDLLVEQVKMLAGEIAFSTSTLKRLVEQSANDPESSQTQVQTLLSFWTNVLKPYVLYIAFQLWNIVNSGSVTEMMECEIQEKRKQMRMLEQRIVESGEASIANASFVEMQQTLMKLMTQCSEHSFEPEFDLLMRIKSADNRILQEQLQNKCLENKELQERICHLEQQLAAVKAEQSYPSSERSVFEEYVDELRRKIQSQNKSSKAEKRAKTSKELAYNDDMLLPMEDEHRKLAAQLKGKKDSLVI